MKYFIQIFLFSQLAFIGYGNTEKHDIENIYEILKKNLISNSKITETLIVADSIMPIYGLPIIINKIKKEKNEFTCNQKAIFNLGLADYLDTRNLRDSALKVLNTFLNDPFFGNCEIKNQLRIKEQIAQRYLRNKEYSQCLDILNNLDLSVFDSVSIDITRKLNIYRISILFDLDEIEEALYWAKKMHKSLESINNPYFLFANFKDLAIMYMRLNQLDSSLYWLNQQEKLLTEIDKNLAHHYYNTLGLVKKRMGDYNSAQESFNKAISISKELGLLQNIKSPLVNKANTYLKQNNAMACINTINEVLEYFPFEENKIDLKAAYENLVDAYLLLKDYEMAYKENLKLEEINLVIYKNIYDNKVNKQLNQLERTARENEALLLRNELIIKEASLLNKKIQNQSLIGVVLIFSFLVTTVIIYQYHKSQKLKIKLKQEHELINSRLKAQQLIFENEQLKALDEQKAKIGADLHDSLGNLILLYNQNNSNPALENVYQTIRNYAHQLNNITLKHFGLHTALEELKEILEKSEQIKFKIKTDCTLENLSQEYQYNLYQIIQELISNAVKHGKATLFEIRIFLFEQKLMVEILDNGSEIKKSNSIGIGLESINNRLNVISASLKKFRVKKMNYSQISIN